MGKRILGLDLGTNSIGWAVVDEIGEKIIDAGVRIFPEGVDKDTIGKGENEKTKNAGRRDHRQTRRQFYRKRLRKAKLLEVLIEQGMCPLTVEELNCWRRWDQEKKSQGKKFPDSKGFMDWIRLNPYELRSKAIVDAVTRQELGRIFYHLIQRRGFLSSRIGDVKESETLFEKGKPETNILPIKTTKDEMDEKGYKTLGQYLNGVRPVEGQPYVHAKNRARGRYATRQMYIEEFEAIWNAQAVRLGLDKEMVAFRKVRRLQGGAESIRNQKRIARLEDEYGKSHVYLEAKGKHTLLVTTRDLPLKEFLAGRIWEEEGELKFKSNESVLFVGL